MRLLRRRPQLLSATAFRDSWDVDVLVWAGGDPTRVGDALSATLEELRDQLPEAFVTFLADGQEWEKWLRPSIRRFPRYREIVLPQSTDLPQLLYARGLTSSTHPWATFLWPGCHINRNGLLQLREAANGDLVYGDLATIPEGVVPPIHRDWLQMADLIPMNHCLLATGLDVHFDQSPRLQHLFWWDFTLRLSRRGRLVYVPAGPPAKAWQWRSFPFRYSADGDDLAARYLARAGAGGEEAFYRDLSGLKITLFSAINDGHHNQLFFYNFFRLLIGTGKLTWRTLLYDGCTPDDLAKCDLAIFSRPRFPEVPALLEACRSRGIPVLVMIDDNWIAAGQEFSRFQDLFTPGKQSFEIFLDSIRRADAVLVFNHALEEELLPFAKRIFRMPPNIDLSRFNLPNIRAPGFVVGFAGSQRFDEAGFHGLARFLARRPDVRLLIMAHDVPAPLKHVAAERLTFIGWRHDYDAYTRDLTAAQPDVLIAPLDASRFSASKIPIKFLESAAVGAAGIYSRVPPYTEYIIDGETGLLVENQEEAWEEALEQLYADPALRRRIAAKATAVVCKRFTTERLLPSFLDIMRSLTVQREIP